MESIDINNLLDQLADCLRHGRIRDARHLSQSGLVTLLKSVYMQVRGQAPPAAMRGLLELEIEIGGDQGDFRAFDHRQMIDLFVRGDVVGHMAPCTDSVQQLAMALDLRALARWFDDPEVPGEGTQRPAALRFVQAWLELLADQAGLRNAKSARIETPPLVSKAVVQRAAVLPEAGKPHVDPITGMRFVYVPGGAFSMGDTFSEGVEDEKPVHGVTLSAFYMAACPVTQAQWECLMENNPSGFSGADHPVEQVTLADVMAFIDQLNAASTGLHFDLPTEAQWEYAARSGGKNELYAGGTDPDAVAWFEDNNTGSTAPVGTKTPNGLGLYDMSGNVWEWCRDIYHPEAYRQHDKLDPICTRGGADRVIRGGSWHLDAWSARCSRRFRFDPELFGPALGFRLVMTVKD